MYQIISDSKLSQPVSRIPVHILLLICMNIDPMRFPCGRGNLMRRLRLLFFFYLFFFTKSDWRIYAMRQQTLSNNKTYEKWNLLKVYILFVSLTIHNYMDTYIICHLFFSYLYHLSFVQYFLYCLMIRTDLWPTCCEWLFYRIPHMCIHPLSDILSRRGTEWMLDDIL